MARPDDSAPIGEYLMRANELMSEPPATLTKRGLQMLQEIWDAAGRPAKPDDDVKRHVSLRDKATRRFTNLARHCNGSTGHSLVRLKEAIPSSRPGSTVGAARRCGPRCRIAAPAKPARSVVDGTEHGAKMKWPRRPLLRTAAASARLQDLVDDSCGREC